MVKEKVNKGYRAGYEDGYKKAFCFVIDCLKKYHNLELKGSYVAEGSIGNLIESFFFDMDEELRKEKVSGHEDVIRKFDIGALHQEKVWK